MNQADVPSLINLRLMSDAQEWERTAMDRPFREDFFAAFANELRTINLPSAKVLELGSGPGFLAQHLLSRLPGIDITLLDFSVAMHTLARQRLADFPDRTIFVERSFKEIGWPDGLGHFDCIITQQAVHELRHKRYAAALHAQVRKLVSPHCLYLVCDHFCGEGGMQNDQLYMSVAEQQAALIAAGFANVVQVLKKGSMVLHRAV